MILNMDNKLSPDDLKEYFGSYAEMARCFDVNNAEKEVYGVDHTEVGEHIAKLWKLPLELTTIIAKQNHPASVDKHRELVAIVRFADILCEIWGADIYEGFTTVELDKEESWQVLCESFPHLQAMDVEIFTFELEKDFKKSSTFLNLIAQDAKK